MTEQPKSPGIRVVDYDLAWPAAFAALAMVYAEQLGELLLRAEHVGSTSVSGLAAKPIIDIDLVVEPANIPAAISQLVELGYEHQGELGIVGRQSFRRPTPDVPQSGNRREWPNHHLYLCPVNSPELARHVAFRDYLRNHPAAVMEYGRLKQDLAKRFRFDQDGYTQAKTEFIASILKHAQHQSNQEVKQMHIAYGTEHLELKLPEGTTVAQGKELPALFDAAYAVQYALRFPLGSAPLAGLVNPMRKVVILLSDATRPTGADVYLPILLRDLEISGMKDENITLLVGTGAHGVLHANELDNLVSPAIRKRYRLVSHDCFDESQLVKVGTTSRGNDVWFNRIAVEADLRILTGAVSIHPFAGFGGGRKALFPGVAGYDSICRNHALLLHQNAKPGILEGNPVHEDLMEGVAMVGRNFLINTVVNEAGEVAAIFGGDIEQAHAAGVRAVEFSAAASVPEAADTVVASAGGFPYDINLYQAVKAMQNANRIVKDGGKILLFAKCEQGVGSANFEEWGKQRLSSKQLAAQLEKQFVLGKHKCFFLSEIIERADLYLCSDLSDELVSSFGIKPFHELSEISLDGHVVVLPRATATLPKVE